MVMLVFLGVRDEDEVLGALGLSVIWLNIAAFILSSVLIKTELAKRLSLWFVARCGHSARTICFAFLVLQLAIAPFIPASAARTVMTLPIMIMVGAIYGATPQTPNNVGKNLFLLNQQGINMSGAAFLTGSAANIIAVAFIMGMASHRVYYSDWMFGALPVVFVTLVVSWFIGPRFIFPVKPEDLKPKIEGGIEKIREESRKMGKITSLEKRGAAIFAVVLFLWMTDRFHMQWFGFEISPVMAALIGAAIALSPRIGLLKWKEADIPWDVLIFSAGAYAGGLALESTGAARWLVGALLDAFHIKPGINFWVVYIIVMAVSAYTHIVFTSKTMRTLILIPVIIALAQKLGFNPVALALPAAFTIDWVITLPINSKPNVILYSTGQFSVFDSFKYGVVVTTIGLVFLIVAGFTLYRVLGIVPY
jgi:anion transporter